MRWAKKTLESVYSLWGRPVWLETRKDDQLITLRYSERDGHATEAADAA
jgi:spore cortex formation protein SpoVR/YcgB (stage V sporulation)